MQYFSALIELCGTEKDLVHNRGNYEDQHNTSGRDTTPSVQLPCTFAPWIVSVINKLSCREQVVKHQILKNLKDWAHYKLSVFYWGEKSNSPAEIIVAIRG